MPFAEDNKDYNVGVMTSGEDHNNLRTAQCLSSTFPNSAVGTSHILPMLLEVHFKDILGFFPKASQSECFLQRWHSISG